MTMYQLLADDLRRLLDPLDSAPVECDGMTRLACTVLAREDIEHRVFVGSLTIGDQAVVPHFWIEVGRFLIDYRARMWMGAAENVPHGVCIKAELEAVYQGEQIDMLPLSDELFDLLAMPWPALPTASNVDRLDKSHKIKGMS